MYLNLNKIQTGKLRNIALRCSTKSYPLVHPLDPSQAGVQGGLEAELILFQYHEFNKKYRFLLALAPIQWSRF